MRSLKTYLEEQELQESLTTPVEFYMTDDTKMPFEIYAAFDVNGNTYGCSLILSEYANVYQLDFYRVVNVKKRFWSFLNAKDIRPCLSTIIRFFESCVPFVHNKMDGVIINLPKKKNADKYQKFLNRIVMKSFMKKYKLQPAVKSQKKNRNFMFLIKRGKTPQQIFDYTVFRKNYEFLDGIPQGVFDNVDDYKKVKQTVSIKPSTRYAFAKVKLDAVLGDDLFNTLEAATVKTQAKKDLPEEPTFHGELANQGYHFKTIAISSGDYNNPYSMIYLMSIVLDKAYNQIEKNGFDESKFNFKNFKYAFKEGAAKLPQYFKDQLKEAMMMEKGQSGELNAIFNEENAMNFLRRFQNPEFNPNHRATLKGYIAAFDEAQKSYQQKEKEFNNAKKTTYGQTLELDMDFTPSIKIDNPMFIAMQEETTADNLFGYYGVNQIGGLSQFGAAEEYKKTMLNANPQMKAFYEDAPMGGKYLRIYSGPVHETMNKRLRDFVSNLMTSNGIMKKGEHIDSNTHKLMEYFRDHCPRLDEPMWVFRNSGLPEEVFNKIEPGFDFVDTAFYSTTIRPNMRDPEFEMLLPPASMFKVYRVKYFDPPKAMFKLAAETIFVGSAYDDMLNKVDNEISFFAEQKRMSKKKDTHSQNKGDKMGGSLTAKEMEFMTKLIKSGKLKLDKGDKNK